MWIPKSSADSLSMALLSPTVRIAPFQTQTFQALGLAVGYCCALAHRFTTAAGRSHVRLLLVLNITKTTGSTIRASAALLSNARSRYCNAEI